VNLHHLTAERLDIEMALPRLHEAGKAKQVHGGIEVIDRVGDHGPRRRHPQLGGERVRVLLVDEPLGDGPVHAGDHVVLLEPFLVSRNRFDRLIGSWDDQRPGVVRAQGDEALDESRLFVLGMRHSDIFDDPPREVAKLVGTVVQRHHRHAGTTERPDHCKACEEAADDDCRWSHILKVLRNSPVRQSMLAHRPTSAVSETARP
jgi:hypothetical protein